jgi:hypothetical protein
VNEVLNVLLKYLNESVMVMFQQVNEVLIEELQVEYEVVHDYVVLLVEQFHRNSLILDVIVDQKEAFLSL